MKELQTRERKDPEKRMIKYGGKKVKGKKKKA